MAADYCLWALPTPHLFTLHFVFYLMLGTQVIKGGLYPLIHGDYIPHNDFCQSEGCE